MRQHIKKVGTAAPLPAWPAQAAASPVTCPSSPSSPPPLAHLPAFNPFKQSTLQLEEMRKNEDPRLSFSTPEFKEAQRQFTDAF